jgi:hypothetical protein
MNLALAQTERKLSKEIEDKIKDVDILTDFDGTMIKEESQYVEVLAYFFSKHNNRLEFAKEMFNMYKNYKKNGEVCNFYSLLKGCSVEVLDRITGWISQNEKWNKLIEFLKPQKIGIVSRNNKKIISKYLDELNYQSAEISLVAANNPEINEDFYTGKVEIIVNNKNLIDFIGKKEYICDVEEKDILEKLGAYPKKIKGGLYICEGRKIF